ncbi:SDR family oxidoreductase [Bradyrhizobium yuanmingense]|uniref:SDR family oxidoreductase n=1 Tax=Bradyrhizobium yuanmingense TaxID=108015 RepID=UPI0023B8D9B5|nr:SDR family oxidoreductase [Bradyrhizobium yuanmingense]MDF0498629.1 SDR family oxidoreductase [Bradyrhizobium yuanmingense]
MSTVLITGSNRGLGFGLAQEYAAKGANVIACCRNPATAEPLHHLAASSGNRVRIIELDVGNEASIASLKRTLGEEPIDILINNAAIVGPKDQSPTRIDAEGWITTLRVNALGPMLLAQALYDNLRRGGEKKLVAISSRWGCTSLDLPDARHRYAYRASKAALNNGMRALSRDWADNGVLVGILHPGYVWTEAAGPAALAPPTSVSPRESARGLMRLIAELTPATSGDFRSYKGEALPW